jgi:hypothetical protein
VFTNIGFKAEETSGEESYVYMISDGDNHSIGYRFADGSSEEESTYE